MEDHMLIRTWKVHIHKDKIGELKHFAKTKSLPMFKEQTGCLGVLFTLDGNLCNTTTLWRDRESIEMLKTSITYNDTVEKIVATGMLEGESTVEIFDCFGGFLELDTIAQSLPS